MTDETNGHARRETDRFMTRRESDTNAANHEQIHVREKEALNIALDITDRDRKTHDLFHDREHDAHLVAHEKSELAVKLALEAVSRERELHNHFHDREHAAHQREHGLDKLAIDKAEQAADKLFAKVEGEIKTFREDTDRRFREARELADKQHNELRLSITNIEKGDVKTEGKGIGQAAVVSYIALGVSALVGIFAIISYLGNAIQMTP